MKTIEQILFQFHKGSIKSQGRHARLAEQPGFNSIKVRLKGRELQIHHLSFWFQFHKGSIKSSRKKIARWRMCCFNSIKVRLKDGWEKGAYASKVFQFHKGSIKSERDSTGEVRRAWFQFHKGSIKRFSLLATMQAMNRFNSIKVRLKGFVHG